ncbi:MAG: response regulator [Calothrix sp. SM1_5_4]|nr:response regulator [Calothrix sp. SM1_5_4]
MNPPKLDGLRILIVDDDESMREAICIYLVSLGAEVMPVGSAAEALERFPTFRPSVLVSDLAMPGEDGYGLIRKVRDMSPANGGDIPALAMSSHTTKEDVKASLAAGFQAHMAKPVEAIKLGRAILKISRQRKR